MTSFRVPLVLGTIAFLSWFNIKMDTPTQVLEQQEQFLGELDTLERPGAYVRLENILAQMNSTVDQQLRGTDPVVLEPEKPKEESNESPTTTTSTTTTTTTDVMVPFETPDLSDKRYDFDLDNLAPGPHPCGQYKCLYPLKVDPHYGWVAGGDALLIKSMQQSYKLAQIIEEKYQMQQVFVSEYKRLKIKRVLLDFLNSDRLTGATFLRNKHFTNKVAHIQLVRIMDSKDSFFWGSTDNKVASHFAEMDEWLTRVLKTTTATPESRQQVLQNFITDNEKLDVLLKDIPCLWLDFQLFIQDNGHLVHLDLDRCFQVDQIHTLDHYVPPASWMVTLYAGRLKVFRKYVQYVLETGELPPIHPIPTKPQTISGSKQVLLNAHAYATQELGQHFHVPHVYHETPAPEPNRDNQNEYVQSIQVPEDAMLWWFDGERTRQVAQFLTEGRSEGERVRAMLNLEISVGRMLVLRADKRAKHLFTNFKAFIRKDGVLVHTDLQRMYEPESGEFRHAPGHGEGKDSLLKLEALGRDALLGGAQPAAQPQEAMDEGAGQEE